MIYNVMDYGAKGDGVANDTAAIQAAVNAAHAAGGGQVYIPAGTYIVSGQSGNPTAGCITIYDNTTVYGDGMGATTVKLQNGWNHDVTGIFRDPYNVGSHDLGMHDLTIDGNRANNTGKIDGWFNGTAPGSSKTDTNITLDHIEVKNCGGYGFDPHEITTNLVITNCVSHGNGLDGFALDYQINAHIDNNTAYGNDRHGFNIVTSTHDSELTGNVAYGNGGEGIMVQRGSTDIPVPNNITITGGSLYNNTLDGIQINMADHITVNGVDIHDNGQRGVRIRGSIGSIVENSTLHDDSHSKNLGYDEISIAANDDTSGASGRIYASTGTLITGNTITETESVHAIYSVRETGTNVDYTTVSHNTISGTSNNNQPLFTGSHSTFDPSAADQPPVAQPDSFSDSFNTTLTGNVLSDNGHGKDSDPNGYLLSVTAFNGQTTGGGTLALHADGTFTYTPQTGFTGSDRFNYTLLDGRGGTDTGAVSIAVAATVTNHPPVANPDNFADPFNTALSGNVLANNGHGADSDPDGDALSVTAFNGQTANGGTLALHTDGTFNYTPQFGYAGSDQFSYTLSDGHGGTASAAVTIAIPAPPGALVGTNGDDVITGGSQNDIILGLNGTDTLNGTSGSDTIYAGSGNDTLSGGTGQDVLYGGAGNDTLNGNDDNDILYAGSGTDLLYGGKGNDTLVAATGSATMTGNTGVDTFQFTSANTGSNAIVDFKTGDGDKIDIHNVLQDYDPNTKAISDYVHATQSGSNTVLSVDSDGTANGSHFTDLTVLQGLSHFDVAAMVASGNLIV